LDAIKTGDRLNFNRLMTRGIDVSKPGKFSWLPLYQAIESNSVYCVRRLLKAGAKVNMADSEQVSPLELAVRQWKRPMVKILLDAGADPNWGGARGSHPLITVCAVGDVELTKCFLDKGADPNVATFAGGTPLIAAANARALPIVRLLSERGANIEWQDSSGWSALFHAIQVPLSARLITRRYPSGPKALIAVPTNQNKEDWEARLRIIEFLLERGADPNRRDKKGRTPLTYDVSAESSNTLFRAGARMDLRDKRGHDVAYWLRRNGLCPRAIELYAPAIAPPCQ
jgi:ankyrin repeat protein